jgi:hypothetical protein
MMAGKARPRHTLSATLVATVLYSVVLLMTPALHHDFACHQNSRSHCTSCLTSQSAPHVEICAAPIAAMAAPGGRIETRPWVAIPTAATFSDSGRSPPA